MATDGRGGPGGVQRRKPRVGLVVPPANTAVEDDYLALGGHAFAFSTTRYGVHSDLPLRQRLDHYAAELPSRLASFGDMPLHAIVACCSGNNYLQGFGADLCACRRSSDRIGTLIVSTTVAVVGWLRHRDVGTITVASPYPDWLTELSKSYWDSAGLRISSVIRIVDGRTGTVAPSPYQLRTEDITAAVHGVCAARRPGAPVLFLGTGMHTREAVAALTHEFAGQEFFTTNSCSVDWLRLTLTDPNPLARLR